MHWALGCLPSGGCKSPKLWGHVATCARLIRLHGNERICWRSWMLSSMPSRRSGKSSANERLMAIASILEETVRDARLPSKQWPSRACTRGPRSLAGMFHSFALWFLVRRLQPSAVVESGVFKGATSWLLQKALSRGQPFTLVQLDPSPAPTGAQSVGTTNQSSARIIRMRGRDFVDFAQVC